MEGNIFLFDSIDGNLNGSFHFVDTLFSRYYGYRYGYNCSVSGADLNADGRTDMLIGLYGGGAQIFYQVDPFMAVNEISESNSLFSVYPNPASEFLNISLQKFSSKENYSLSLFNDIGQQVYETKKVREKMQLDVNEYPAGIYLLQLKIDNGSICKKVMIRK